MITSIKPFCNATQAKEPPRFSPILILFIGVLGIYSGSILLHLAQGQDMPSLVIAAWRLTLASAVLLPLAITRRREELRHMSRSAWGLAFIYA